MLPDEHDHSGTAQGGVRIRAEHVIGLNQSLTPVAGRMWMNGAFAVSDAFLTKLSFDTASYTEGITFSGGHFIIETAGYYQIYSQVIYGSGMTPNAVMQFKVVIDGDPAVSGYITASNQIIACGDAAINVIQGGTVQDTVYLTVGQLVEIWVYKHHPIAGDKDIQAGEIYTFCTIHKL